MEELAIHIKYLLRSRCSYTSRSVSMYMVKIYREHLHELSND